MMGFRQKMVTGRVTERPLSVLFCLWVLGFAAGCQDFADLPIKACPVPGAEGCECGAGDKCDLLEDGVRLVCVANTCERPLCVDGARGCPCDSQDACEDGLVCDDSVCSTDTGQTLSRPSNPRCYTPCKGGGIEDTDGNYHACEGGLVEGCIDRSICVDGSCIAETKSAPIRECDGDMCPCTRESDCEQGEICDGGECRPDPLAPSTPESSSVGVCDEDDDCPTHQNCIEGQCYSDCESSADCRPGRQCHNKACRVPCIGDSTECPEGTACETDDGLTGYCMPLGVDTSPDREEPTTKDDFKVGGDFSVAPPILSLNHKQASGSFTVTNDSNAPRCFTVRKNSHTEYAQSGSMRITDYPLHWVALQTDAVPSSRCDQAAPGEDTDAAAAQQLGFELEPGESTVVSVSGAVNPVLRRWDGDLVVSSPNAPEQRVALTFTGSAEGQWVGKIFYFGNFGTVGLQQWLDSGKDRSKLPLVGNALVRRWAAVRDRRLSVQEFRAALDQTVSGQWRTPSVKNRCPTEEAPNPNVACYLYNNAPGISILSDYLPDNPVPTGVTEFPVVMNLHASGEASPGVWEGKFVSNGALQYAGDPHIGITFQRDPSSCPAGEDSCVNLITSLDSTVLVGGRYIADANDPTCAGAQPGTFTRNQIPWLVPGFNENTYADQDGSRFRYECRDTLLPLGAAGQGNGANESLAGSNPIPDGASRRRQLELIDGALVNQETLLIIFRETFPSFLGDDDGDFAAYGVMELALAPTQLDEGDYVGTKQEDDRQGTGLPALTCDDAALQSISASLTRPDITASERAIALVTGLVPSAEEPPLIDRTDEVDSPTLENPSPDQERVHYLCEDNGLFDTGPEGETPCPEGSAVTWFTLTGTRASQASIDEHTCQTCPEASRSNCGCQNTLQAWIDNGSHGIRLNPARRCADPEAVDCPSPSYDLRDGQVFFKDSPKSPFSPPIDTLIDEAFRYKTKFRNRDGINIGFAPEVCSSVPGETPYCYDPTQIQKLRTRIDCIIHAYVDPDERDAREADFQRDEANFQLRTFLERTFAYREEFRLNANPITHDGFERLYSELLIMMGDEAVTDAYSSRFDLAELRVATFQGDKFEPGGIVVPGGAGFEMVSLYRAVQYYQLALDRFYKLSPAIWESMGRLRAADNFITAATVSSYFSRLTKASTAKASALSRIAEQYQIRNRADLARHVVQRAYAAAHLESVVLLGMMQRVIDLPNSPTTASILFEIEGAQRRYTRALSKMREVFEGLTDDVTYFGFQQDYIPFPVLNQFDATAFEKSYKRAMQKLDIAKEKETRALAEDRTFETSAAEFQSQLASISRDYDGRLGAVCGTFSTSVGGGQQIFPATREYIDLLPGALSEGDPCGRVGNGELYNAGLRLEQAQARFNAVKISKENLLAEIADSNARAQAQCGRLTNLYNFERRTRNKITSLQASIGALNEVSSAMQRQFDTITRASEIQKCLVIGGFSFGTSCVGAAVGTVATTTAGTVLNVVQTAIGVANIGLQVGVSLAETEIALENIDTQCEATRIDTEFTVKSHFRRINEVAQEIVAVAKDVEIAMAEIRRLVNESDRLQADQDETTQLAVDVEAARNDPNIRLYRNDSILEADRTYEEARREAYRATKVFEYYTAQSYPDVDSLLDVRMVSHGGITLEAYLSELSEAFYQFQENYGNDDLRLQIVSLRDDIFDIPRLGPNGQATTDAERREEFQRRLQDPTLLDARGYRRIPFATDILDMSPATLNHKIAYVEIDVLANTTPSETIARMYLEQSGTSTVRQVDDDLTFYALPKRTAVIDVLFNNVRWFGPELYKSELLKDRPVVNTRWDLVINTKDETANDDLDLSQITDIRILLFYTDFAAQ